MRVLVFAVLVSSVAALAQKNSDLEKAQKDLAAKKYADALKSIEAAEKKGGIDHDSYMTLLESKGLALASTKKLDKAQEAFEQLLALDPRRDMAGKYKGDVVKALDAALDAVKKSGGLEVVALDPGVQGGKVKQVSVSVKNDPLKQAKAARIYLKQDGGTWKPVEVAFTNGVAAADTDGAAVEFWVSVLDDKKDELSFVGSAIRPVKQSAPAEVAEAPKPKPAAAPAAEPKREEEAKLTPKEEPKPAESISSEEPKKSSSLRPVSYALLGVGVVAAAVGVYFGASSASARSSILADQMTGGFSQQALYDRDQAAIGQAKIANGLFISAAVIAVIGVVMFVLGG